MFLLVDFVDFFRCFCTIFVYLYSGPDYFFPSAVFCFSFSFSSSCRCTVKLLTWNIFSFLVWAVITPPIPLSVGFSASYNLATCIFFSFDPRYFHILLLWLTGCIRVSCLISMYLWIFLFALSHWLLVSLCCSQRRYFVWFQLS